MINEILLKSLIQRIIESTNFNYHITTYQLVRKNPTTTMKNQLLFLFIFLTTPVFAQEKPDSLVFSEAVEMAQAMLDSMDIDAAILGGETFYGMGNGDGEG